MAEKKIKILISLIGKHPDHVDHFIIEKGRYLKKAYLLHTCDSAAPPNRRGILSKKTETIDYGKLAKKTIKTLKKQYSPRIKIIPQVYENAHDIHELQHIIQKIVNTEREKFPQQEQIAIDISGGTNIAAAAQMMSIYKFRLDAYYDDSTKEIGERIQKINTNLNLGRDLGVPALNILKIIQDSEFIIQPAKSDRHRPFPGITYIKIKDGSVRCKYDESVSVIKGQMTNAELKDKVGTKSESPLKLLLDSNFIEKIPAYEVYRDVSLHKNDEPKWEKRPINLPSWRITQDGVIAANTQRETRT
jgi:hypothetical protein